MTIVASHNEILVAETVAPNVVLVAGRIFRCEPEKVNNGAFVNPVNGDEIRTRRDDGRLLVTGWKNAAGDDTAALISGTEGGSVYRSEGKKIGFMALAQRIVDSGKED
jgi:hypothetical protein